METPTPWSERGARYADSDLHRLGPSLPKLLALSRPLPSDRCLDVGTGAGHTAAALARFAGEVFGLDPSDGMLRAARARYRDLDGLTFLSGRGEATGFPDDHIDLVTARHTLHHHPDPAATLAELWRVLKPGGRLVIVDEATPSPEVGAWFHRLEQTRDPSHVRAYTLGEWQAMIREAGLVWVVGDSETRYLIEVESWLERVDADPETAAVVRRLLREADDTARRTFAIRLDGDALSFEMPMALILALKPSKQNV